MLHIPFLGLSDEQIIEFFQSPLSKIQTYELEENRLFEVQFVFSSAQLLRIGSEMVPIGQRDEIGVLFFAPGQLKDYPIEIDVSDFGRSANSIHKVIGEFDREESCECGILIETSKGFISVLAKCYMPAISARPPPKQLSKI